MGKTHISKDLQKRRTSRSLLAVSLAASLAAFGCTTNLNPGNGTPTRSGPEIRTAPTSGVGSGSETVTPPPMTSSYTRSYTGAEVMPRVTPRSSRSIRRSADEAAAIMAGRQALRGRYLGPANPGPGNRPYASDHAGGFVPPALLTNPQLTINSSISSPSTSAINSGAGGVAGVGIATDAGILATTGVTTGTTFAGTTTGGVGGVAATTGTGVGLPAGTFATVRPAVTESIGNNPAVTAASVGVGRAGVPVTGTTTATAATTATSPTAAATATTVTAASGAPSASVTGGVRIIRGSTGGVTITNTRSQ
jgi:hypothetical protein